MHPFDDVDLKTLLNAPEWTDAHDCFREKQPGRGPHEDSYAVVPLWLYARACLEEGKDDRRHQDEPSSVELPPINRLPRTILAGIFEHLRSLCYHQSTSSRHPNQDERNPYTWISVTLVCRHWRNTAYAHPPLWTYINLAYNREMIRSLLILSENESLYVHTDTSGPRGLLSGVREVGEFEIKIDLVMDEQERIKELEMDLSSTKFVKLVPWKQFVSHPWRRLTRLVLRGSINAGDIKPEKRMLPAFVETNFPKLRELVLDGLYPCWRETCLSMLTRLEISNLGSGSCTPREFLGCLERCRMLRLLRIDALDMHMYKCNI